jgi:arginase
MKRNISLIELAAEFGAGTRGASLGVDGIRFACLNKGYKEYFALDSTYIAGDPDRMIDRIEFPGAKRIDLILSVYDQYLEKVDQVFEDKLFPLVISGDHSNAAGTVAAIKKHHPEKRLGVIWIDAHADLHTPYSSPTGNVHGMPVAAILNLTNEDKAVRKPSEETLRHWDTLCNVGGIAPKITSRDMVFIGIRDLEEQEWKIIDENNIKFYSNHHVNELGTVKVIKETKAYLSECDLIYVSFDIDSLDSAIVPGTGTPVPDGLSIGQARDFLNSFWQMENLACLEFTEINPLLDYANQTADVAADLLYDLIK